MHHEIGAFDAKTRLPEFIRCIQEGDSFTITLRGVPVAELVPARSRQRRKFQEAASRMKQFMNDVPLRNDVTYAETVLDSLVEASAAAPAIWSLEVSNVLIKSLEKTDFTEAHRRVSAPACPTL